MAENQILPFAYADGANVLSQSDYQSDNQRLIGHQPGIARSALENKALRQASAMAAGLAQWIAGKQDANVTDDKTPEEIAAMIGDATLIRSNFTSATDGYFIFESTAGNIIVQCMRVIHRLTGQDFVLPIAFPGVNFSCFASYNHQDEAVNAGPITIAPQSAQSVRIWKSTATPYSIGILAIGR